jgi:hypothetical protein
MKPLRCLAALLILLAVSVPALPEDKAKDDGFVPMFDGKTLKGWVNVNCAPGTFYVKDGQIITTGKPTGYLRTEKQYENFIAEFDWMHIPPKPGAVGNSGFFVWADPIPAVGTGYTRGIEVQVLVNLEKKDFYTSQGDLFSIWGAHCTPDRPHPQGWERCLPNGNFTKGEREWNHYRVTGKDGRITLEVNGHEVSGVSKCTPRKGYLALESEGSECRFKNLKIKELPGSKLAKDEIANVAEGHRQLYYGELTGWQADDEAKKHWQPKDTVMHYDGKGEALRTEKEYANAEFIADFRFPGKDEKSCEFVLRQGKNGHVKVSVQSDGKVKTSLHYTTPDGAEDSNRSSSEETNALKPAGQWNRLQAILGGKTLKITINGKPLEDIKVGLVPLKGTFALSPSSEMDFANIFVRELKKD